MSPFELLRYLIAATLRLWTPLALGAMGGVVSERSGVINIAIEGMMLAGAFGAVVAAKATGSPLAGLALGVAAGALTGLLHAALTQALRVPHILSGVGINLGVLGITTFALRQYGGGLETRALLPSVILFSEKLDLTTVLALLVVAAVWAVLYGTPVGLRLRACGENPGAVRAAGINPVRLRYGAVTTAGALAGLGGVSLALSGLGAFTENMTAGRGYIALAAVIFGRWDPLGAALAALLFGFGDALQLALQTLGYAQIIPADFLTLLPYLVTLAALFRKTRDVAAPAALGDTER
jgi:simple sugar transport system permease protein